MNVFELAKKAGLLEDVAKDAVSVVEAFEKLDVDGNGIPDAIQILADLKKLPALLEAAEKDDKTAEADLHDLLLTIGKVVGNDIAAIQAKAKDEIAALKEHVTELQK